MYLDLSPDFLIDNISKDEEKLLLESLYKTMISKFHYIDRIYININGIPYKSVNYSFKYKVAFLEENIDFSKFELNYKDEKVIHSYHDSSQEDYQDDDSNELGGFWWAEMYEKEKKEKSDLANGY